MAELATAAVWRLDVATGTPNVEERVPSKLAWAGVAELADAQDLKSCGAKAPSGFDARPRHQSTQ